MMHYDFITLAIELMVDGTYEHQVWGAAGGHLVASPL